MPGGRKRRQGPELKAAVISHARQIIIDEGLHGVAARRLADLADCSVGTIYNLFGHLEAVVREVNLETGAELAKALTASLAPVSASPVERRLTALATAYLDFALAHPNLWRSLFDLNGETAPDPRMTEMQAELFEILSTAAKDPAGAMDQGHLRALWASVHGVAALAVGQHLHGATLEEIRSYPAMVVRAGLLGWREANGTD